MEPRIDVITLAVADLKRALAFYRAIAMLKLDGGPLLNLYPRADLAKDAASPLHRHIAASSASLNSFAAAPHQRLVTTFLRV